MCNTCQGHGHCGVRAGGLGNDTPAGAMHGAFMRAVREAASAG